MCDKCELAWAAGFYDGEGSVIVNKNVRANYVFIQISQASDSGVPEVLLRFKTAVGNIGTINPTPYKKYNRKPLYKFQASCNAARTIISLLWPYLSSIKRQQIWEVYQRLHMIPITETLTQMEGVRQW